MRNQRRNAQASLDAQKDNHKKRRDVVIGQQLTKAKLAMLKETDRKRKAIGSARASFATAGLSFQQGSGRQIGAQINLRSNINQELLATQLNWDLQQIQSDFAANTMASAAQYNQSMINAQAQMSNPLLAGLSGGLSGAQTGLSIQQGLG